MEHNKELGERHSVVKSERERAGCDIHSLKEFHLQRSHEQRCELESKSADVEGCMHLRCYCCRRLLEALTHV